MKNKKKNKSIYGRSRWRALLLLLPFMVLVFLFHYYPLWGWSYALFDYKPGRDLFECDFVGLKHFTALFTNRVMRGQLFNALKNTLGQYGLGLLLSWMPMFFAIFLTEMRSSKCKKLIQTATSLPNFLSWVIMYSMVFGMLNMNTGVINRLLLELNIIEEPVNFLTSPDHVWIKMEFLNKWKGLGWGSILYLAAIAGLDQEVYEAAMVDGAGRWKRIWYITLPGLIPTYLVLLIMNVASVLNSGMDKQLVFANAMNKHAIEVLDFYVYNVGLKNGQISFATAISIMKTGVSLVLFGSANAIAKLLRGESIY